MAIRDKTRKLLWGRSGESCAKCRRKLIIDATSSDDESIIGEECHIISNRPSGPRYDPDFPESKLDSYENIIILCRDHHKEVDDQPNTFTTEYLHIMKKEHEKWVSEQLDQGRITVDNQISRLYFEKFRKVNQSMPELIAEIKDDLSREGNQLVREFFIVGKQWCLNVSYKCFCYYFEDHDELQNKIHVLDNCGFVTDITTGKAKKYRMTEEFVELVLSS